MIRNIFLRTHSRTAGKRSSRVRCPIAQNTMLQIDLREILSSTVQSGTCDTLHTVRPSGEEGGAEPQLITSGRDLKDRLPLVAGSDLNVNSGEEIFTVSRR